ncbi:MAG: mechanosensitive ion channel family protein [Chitinispirillales bacterium]|jgi:miniconductance mechanosensitive channel|nr:mechanosensitive ion channel family protein [Chitinispirillales bacterium]
MIDSLSFSGFSVPRYAVNTLILIGAALVLYIIAAQIFVPVFNALSRKSKSRLNSIIVSRRVLNRTLLLFPAVIISFGLPLTVDTSSELFILLNKIVNLYIIVVSIAIYTAMLSVIHDIYDLREDSKRVGITGIIQALKVVGIFFGFIIAASSLAGKSPVYYLSGLGAFTAILLLIFKDSILGLVAGIQVSTLDLVRRGDWIEIPRHGADGEVIDISLTTVKVRNWDKTITAVPAYELISSSFKNWRGIRESGGRRIKRSMRFDINSIRFLNTDDIEYLHKIKLLKPYLESKLKEIESSNTEYFSKDDLSILVNGRRLTNIGTFRAYCDAYLRNNSGIHKDLMIMVRQLEPTEFGLPLELYAFTNDPAWQKYESVQSDIFDHLLSILPEFGLKAYQR